MLWIYVFQARLHAALSKPLYQRCTEVSDILQDTSTKVRSCTIHVVRHKFLCTMCTDSPGKALNMFNGKLYNSYPNQNCYIKVVRRSGSALVVKIIITIIIIVIIGASRPPTGSP